MWILQFSPLKTAPKYTDDLLSILTSPIIVAFGAINSASRSFGNLDLNGKHLREGTTLY